jgi:hypothetical protein
LASHGQYPELDRKAGTAARVGRPLYGEDRNLVKPTVIWLAGCRELLRRSGNQSDFYNGFVMLSCGVARHFSEDSSKLVLLPEVSLLVTLF